MPDFPDLLILRHGETEWNRQGRMQGEMDSPLTDKGRGHASDQGTILRRFGIDDWPWYSSPQGRAHRTAKIAAQGLNVRIQTDPRLAEIRMGDWTGRLRADLIREAPALFDDPDSMVWYDHAPKGEGLLALEERTRAFLRDISEPSVVVTHGITSRVMRCILMGQPAEMFDQQPGGQGLVYHLSDGQQKQLTLGG